MRVWIDVTNSPHVLFFRPLIRLLEEDGHEVEVTAREYAQTLELLRLHGAPAPRRRAAARRRRRPRQGALAGGAAAAHCGASGSRAGSTSRSRTARTS